MVEPFRAIIMPSYDENKTPSRQKIPAADGIMGIIAMLSYWGGGTNLFPDGVNPEFFHDAKESNGIVHISAEGITMLASEHSKVIKRVIGSLSIGSLPVYLTALRKGRRANGNGEFIPVQTAYYKDTQKLVVFPRNYVADQKADLIRLLPEGLI